MPKIQQNKNQNIPNYSTKSQKIIQFQENQKFKKGRMTCLSQAM
jgi:hypothetical protein